MTMNNGKIAKFQLKHILLFFSIFVFVLVAFIIQIISQSNEYLEQDEKALQKYFHDFKNQTNNKFYQLENRLKQIKSSAEANLQNSRETGVRFPTSYKLLRDNTTEKYFHMDDAKKAGKTKININITGDGTFRNRSVKFERILEMGMNLYDEFHALKETIPEIIYIYYTSTEKIIVHYPWFASKDYRFNKDLYDYELWKLSLPQNNPKQKIYWVNVYIDISTGGGLMTTCAIPLYDDNVFIGLIGVDLTVDFLNLIVAGFEPQRKGNTVIFDSKQNLVAHPTLISYKDKKVRKLKEGLPVELASKLNSILKAPDDTIIEEGKWKFIKSRFANAPFSILYYFPKQTLMNIIVSKMGYGSMGFIVCMLILVFSSLFITHKKLVQPSEKFVNFILAKSRNKEVQPDKRIPRIWKPWFATIDNVFNENNKLNEDIKQNNIVLEHKNVELQKEIEAKEKAEKAKQALEKQLIEEEKLKTIGLLSGGIAHDFNNQLAIIMGYAGVLRSPNNLSKEKKLECLDQILSSANNSSSLIKQLLAFSRKGKYQNIPVSIHEIIGEVISILSHTIDKRISVKVDLNAPKYTVKGDPAQIQNVIMNIAINAQNAMPNGGMITFKTTNETFTKEQCENSGFDLRPGKFIKISIIDTGIGIPQADKERIFEPFFTTKNSGHGFGLGLAAAMGTIKNHQGSLAVESALGVGTEFCILLPVMGKNTTEIKPAKIGTLNISESKVRLLLIDDEKAFCRMLTDFMGALGYTIVTYSNPLKAAEYYRNSWEEVDLVIMDMIMPKISGYDMINRFEKINPQVRIVISSAYSDDNELQKLLKNNEHIIGFYKKPFDLIRFANDISLMLEQGD